MTNKIFTNIDRSKAASSGVGIVNGIFHDGQSEVPIFPELQGGFSHARSQVKLGNDWKLCVLCVCVSFPGKIFQLII
ncbi:MAG: hypothetical protein ACE5HI_17405 [bacterium]